jgi:hypothetical protein
VHQLLAVPPGVGVSYVLEGLDVDSLQFPVKSRYVLVWSGQRPRIFREEVRLKALAQTSMGTLYLNLDSLPRDKNAATSGSNELKYRTAHERKLAVGLLSLRSRLVET